MPFPIEGRVFLLKANENFLKSGLKGRAMVSNAGAFTLVSLWDFHMDAPQMVALETFLVESLITNTRVHF